MDKDTKPVEYKIPWYVKTASILVIIICVCVALLAAYEYIDKNSTESKEGSSSSISDKSSGAYFQPPKASSKSSSLYVTDPKMEAEIKPFYEELLASGKFSKQKWIEALEESYASSTLTNLDKTWSEKEKKRMKELGYTPDQIIYALWKYMHYEIKLDKINTDRWATSYPKEYFLKLKKGKYAALVNEDFQEALKNYKHSDSLNSEGDNN